MFLIFSFLITIKYVVKFWVYPSLERSRFSSMFFFYLLSKTTSPSPSLTPSLKYCKKFISSFYCSSVFPHSNYPKQKLHKYQASNTYIQQWLIFLSFCFPIFKDLFSVIYCIKSKSNNSQLIMEASQIIIVHVVLSAKWPEVVPLIFYCSQ